jgi:hypothetical protein
LGRSESQDHPLTGAQGQLSSVPPENVQPAVLSVGIVARTSPGYLSYLVGDAAHLLGPAQWIVMRDYTDPDVIEVIDESDRTDSLPSATKPTCAPILPEDCPAQGRRIRNRRKQTQASHACITDD